MMRDYAYSLAERRRRCEAEKTRYRSDPVYRLAKINRARAARGYAPRASLDEVPARRGWQGQGS